MKDIKFRAKDKFTEKWVYGDLVHNLGINEKGDYQRAMVGGYEAIEETIGQFIGRKDKNGVEIYDGDIFQFAPSKKGTVVDKYLVRVSEHLTVEIRNIDLSEKLWTFSCVSKDWWEYFQDEIEVIGNIYDNPELIK